MLRSYYLIDNNLLFGECYTRSNTMVSPKVSGSVDTVPRAAVLHGWVKLRQPDML